MMALIRYWLPVFFILGTIFYISSRPGEEMPSLLFEGQDKVHHFLAYSAVGFLLARAMTRYLRNIPGFRIYRSKLFMAILIGTLYGAIDEYHQSFTPGRSMELADFVADFLGVCFGVWIVIPYRLVLLNTRLIKSPDETI